MILLIDNYDSFTYNLYHYLIQAGAGDVIVRRNDKITLDEVKSLNPRGIMLSPGPCTPDESGVCLEIIAKMHQSHPIFGVCLGHQAIGQIFGGKVIKTHPMHGKISAIHHQGQDVFAGLPSPFNATRYHSLIVERESLPECLEITAQTGDGLIMGLKHKQYKVSGVQFHPESIASQHGHQIIKNFLDKCN